MQRRAAPAANTTARGALRKRMALIWILLSAGDHFGGGSIRLPPGA
jgi:hypothetical protein